MPQTQDSDQTPAAADEFAPVTADMHVSVIARADSLVPERRGVWPLAPWRWVLLAVAMFLAITCGPAAADPAVNMADLGVFLSLGVFVATFTPGRD